MLLFDDDGARCLYPLTLTRPSARLRVGIDTLQDKWEAALGAQALLLAEAHLQELFPPPGRVPQTQIWINGRYLPTPALVAAVKELADGTLLHEADGTVVALRFPAFITEVRDLLGLSVQAFLQRPDLQPEFVRLPWQGPPLQALRRLPDLFSLNGEWLSHDYARLTAGRTSQPITDPHTVVYAPHQVFLEEGVKLRACVLNAEEGPIYLGRGVEVQEGAVIRGSHALLDHCTVHPGARLRGQSSVGPHCKVGGEVQNSILLGYSNKGHDGYLGNSLIGEWCNLGALTTTSNLKNTYQPVKQYNYVHRACRPTGRQFVGLTMGDHAKAAIGSLFNTGAVVGVGANFFDSGLSPRHVPDFSWGPSKGRMKWEDFLKVAQAVMARRNMLMPQPYESVLAKLYELTHEREAQDR